MSIVLVTSLGDIVIDFFTKTCPNHSLNFIKLCKLKYYDNCLFFNVQKDYLCQSGSPYLDETKNTSIFEIVDKKNNKFFSDEISSKFKHNQIGLVCSSNIGPNLNTSGFYITLTNKELFSLNGKHTIFGKVVEGFDVLNKINNCYTDENNRPYQNIRIKHTLIIDDPFDDLPGMIIPNENSINNNNNINNSNIINNPKYLEDTFNIKKLFNDEEITENLLKEKLKEQESKNQALILELLDDLPDSEIKPPENILFVCKLNPITTDEDLENIFERFGHIKSCQIIRDKKTGESLQYAFIEFEKVEDCEKAYLKMNGVLVDDKRIKVDFSQSVSKFWMNSRKNNNNNKNNNEGNELKLDVKLKIKENKNFNIINGIGNKDKYNNNYGMVLSNGNYNYNNKKNNVQYNINKQFYDNIKNHFERSRSKSNHHKHNHKYK